MLRHVCRLPAHRALFVLGLLLATGAASAPVRAERFFWLDSTLLGRGLDPIASTVRVLDEATVIVTDDQAPALPAGALEIEVPARSVVHLVRLRDAAALDPQGVRLLRHTRGFALLAIDPEQYAQYGGSLGERLVRSPRAAPPTSPLLHKRTVDPAVKLALADAVDEVHLLALVEELSGARSFELNGNTMTNNDRNTFRPGQYVAADYLQDRFEALGYAVLRQDFTVASTPTQNIIAVKTGIATPEEIVVVGGHYDSLSLDVASGPAPGAEDNGSGTAAVLHLAEIFAGYDTDRTIHFVAFGGEEQGLYGSQHYVTEAVTNGDVVVAAFTTDMISAFTTNYQIDIEGQANWPALNDLMDQFEANVSAFSPALATVQKFLSFGSDHVPFQNAGIPCFLAIESDYNSYVGYHKTTDTSEKLTPSLGRDVTRAIAVTLADLTDPTPHTDVAVAASGLAAFWTEGAVELRWQVHDPHNLLGFLPWRSDGRGPLGPLLETPLAARAGTMRWRDSRVAGWAPPRVYQLEVIELDGDRWFLPESVQLSEPPRVFWLAQNVPNPFNPRTTIAFSLATDGPVQLDIHDAAGRRVRRLVDAVLPAGPHQEIWDATDDDGQPVASGVFYYRLRHDGSVRTRRMLLAR